MQAGMVVTLKGGFGHKYCSSTSNGTTCASSSVGPWELFHIVDAGGYWGIKAGGSQCVDNTHGYATCNKHHVENWQRFSFVQVGNGKVGIETPEGRFCSDIPAGVQCAATSLTAAEKFTMECIQNCDFFFSGEQDSAI